MGLRRDGRRQEGYASMRAFRVGVGVERHGVVRAGGPHREAAARRQSGQRGRLDAYAHPSAAGAAAGRYVAPVRRDATRVRADGGVLATRERRPEQPGVDVRDPRQLRVYLGDLVDALLPRPVAVRSRTAQRSRRHARRPGAGRRAVKSQLHGPGAEPERQLGTRVAVCDKTPRLKVRRRAPDGLDHDPAGAQGKHPEAPTLAVEQGPRARGVLQGATGGTP